jgi:hypothetical protein
LVTTSPSGDTSDAEQPLSRTMAPSGAASGSARVVGSIVTPRAAKVAAWPGRVICCGSHMPPGLAKARRAARCGSAGAASGPTGVPTALPGPGVTGVAGGADPPLHARSDRPDAPSRATSFIVRR